MTPPRNVLWLVLFSFAIQATVPYPSAAAPVGSVAEAIIDQLDSTHGVCVILGDTDAAFALGLANNTELTIYIQLENRSRLQTVRNTVAAEGLLNRRVFAGCPPPGIIPLADNTADLVVKRGSPAGDVLTKEALRVLRPGGKAILGRPAAVKPHPEGMDSWSHPYHGPDNNPQSTDNLARAPYMTQFIGFPVFSPMPQVTVAAGGRVFRAFGHISHKINQNAILNTLFCINAYNGTVLWKRPLNEGFMIHRNTMIATPDLLYMGDDESCKVIDAATGKARNAIVIPDKIADGPVWKWMGMEEDILYALVGGSEVRPATQRSNNDGLGHWPWKMWEGHDYRNPATSFGFGRTFVAVNTKNSEILWHHSEEDYVDSRGVCMKGGLIYFYSPGKFLGCLDGKTGKVVWKNSDEKLIDAIGTSRRAQHYVTGYATTTFIKCTDKQILFAGPQRPNLVAASTWDGHMLWKHANGNLQLVLREDAIYAAGPQDNKGGLKIDYETGKVIGTLPIRRACTRATGSSDSIFYRTSGGTVRVEISSSDVKHIAPMRPPCQDGVIVSDGHLYWGPWMCGCQLSLYGHIALGPGSSTGSRATGSRLHTQDTGQVKKQEAGPGDWTAYCGNSSRDSVSTLRPPAEIKLEWSFDNAGDTMTTAPVTAGGLTFFGDRDGAVAALKAGGKLLWKKYTGGSVSFPPEFSSGRVFAGSADGRVYAFEAATGRELWSYRVAPAVRLIPVYDKLISTWPVAGGVVVRDGMVYAAAGIAHYDGTHIVALNAATGEPRWHNDTSGKLSTKVDSGISLQGNLYLAQGELRFLGGGAYETARYDVKTGKCRNVPWDEPRSRFHTAFYSHYPEYGKYMSLHHKLKNGNALVFDASYEGSRSLPLTLFGPLAAGSEDPYKPASRWFWKQPPSSRKPLWKDKENGRFTGFVITPDVLLAAGHPANQAHSPYLKAIEIKSGNTMWKQDLPSLPVKGGIAMDAEGSITLALENGRIMRFTPAK